MRIPSVAHCKTSAQVFAEYLAPLYFREHDIVLDPTWGKGNFYTIYEPKHLIKHDKYTLDGVDCRGLPEEDGSVDTVVLDLPLISKGGRHTSGMKEFDKAYGLKAAPKTPAGVHKVVRGGIKEAFRGNRAWRLINRQKL